MKLNVSEAPVVAGVLQVCRGMRIPAARLNTRGDDGQTSGLPDVLVLVPPYGLALAVECKRPASPGRRAGKLRPNQRAVKAVWEAAGGVWWTIDDIRTFAQQLANLVNATRSIRQS